MGDMPVTIPCPKCRQSVTKMVSELEVANEIICPFCGTATDLTNEPWQDAIRAARKQADEFDPKFS